MREKRRERGKGGGGGGGVGGVGPLRGLHGHRQSINLTRASEIEGAGRKLNQCGRHGLKKSPGKKPRRP